MSLKDFQKTYIQAIEKSWANNEPFILGSYTGSGKTNIFLELCRRILKEQPDAKIGIIAHFQRNIKTQVFERAKEFLKPNQYQKLDPQNRDIVANVLIFNPQFVGYNFEFYKNKLKFDYLLVDEAHYGLQASTIGKINENMTTEDTRHLYVTATSWRLHATLPHPGLMRGLDHGIADGLSSPFDIRSIRFKVKLKQKHFTKKGDLKFDQIEITKLVTAHCVNFVRRAKTLNLGNKILIITPPGGDTLCASAVAESLGKSAVAYVTKYMGKSTIQDRSDYPLEQFKTNPNIKYLVTCKKAQIGIDLPFLTTVIDLTMTRNVLSLVQRFGRLSRKFDTKKQYLYVHDDSLSTNQVQWIINTAVRYAICDYKGYGGSIFKQRTPVKVAHVKVKESFEDLVDLVKHPEKFDNTKIVTFHGRSNSGFRWTVQEAKHALLNYSDRTDLSKRNRYLYKWLREYHNDILDAHFPLKVKMTAWSVERIKELAPQFSSRRKFFQEWGGAQDYIRTHKLWKQLDKILPAKNPVDSTVRWVVGIAGQHVKDQGITEWHELNGQARAKVKKNPVLLKEVEDAIKFNRARMSKKFKKINYHDKTKPKKQPLSLKHFRTRLEIKRDEKKKTGS